MAKTASADFAFVLNSAGQLVTRDAPRDMPERGRARLLQACPSEKDGAIAHLDMPREDLVPFGGAAPIDVFAVRVEDTAILAIAMASWNDKANVVLALTNGAASLAEMIRRAKRVRAQKTGRKPAEPRRERASSLPAEPRRERASSPPAEPRRERTTLTPGEPRRERASSAPKPPKETVAAKKPARTDVARTSHTELQPLPLVAKRRDAAARHPSSSPEIVVGEAPLGRDTLSAIERELRGAERAPSAPEIEVGVTTVGRETMMAIEGSAGRETMIAIEAAVRSAQRASSAPQIEIGEAAIGRETMVAIESSLPRPPMTSAPDAIRVQLDSIGSDTLLEIRRIEVEAASRSPTVKEPLVKDERRTLPWVDSAPALKRAADAKAAARGAAPPEIKVSVVEREHGGREAAPREGREGKKR